MTRALADIAVIGGLLLLLAAIVVAFVWWPV